MRLRCWVLDGDSRRRELLRGLEGGVGDRGEEGGRRHGRRRCGEMRIREEGL